MRSDTFTAEAVKIAPPAGVSGMTLLSLPLDNWVLLLTGLYTVILIIEKFSPGICQRCLTAVLNLFRGK